MVLLSYALMMVANRRLSESTVPRQRYRHPVALELKNTDYRMLRHLSYAAPTTKLPQRPAVTLQILPVLPLKSTFETRTSRRCVADFAS